MVGDIESLRYLVRIFVGECRSWQRLAPMLTLGVVGKITSGATVRVGGHSSHCKGSRLGHPVFGRS